MPDDTRLKDRNWAIHRDRLGSYDCASATVAVLQDIRDELKAMNRVLGCPNLAAIPSELRRIRRALEAKRKPRRRRRV